MTTPFSDPLDPWPRRYALAERIGNVLGDVLWPALFVYLAWRYGR